MQSSIQRKKWWYCSQSHLRLIHLCYKWRLFKQEASETFKLQSQRGCQVYLFSFMLFRIIKGQLHITPESGGDGGADRESAPGEIHSPAWTFLALVWGPIHIPLQCDIAHALMCVVACVKKCCIKAVHSLWMDIYTTQWMKKNVHDPLF